MNKKKLINDKWVETTIGDVLENIQTGTTPKKSVRKYYENGSVNWYSPSDFNDNTKYLKEAANKVSEIAVKEKKARIYSPNTILLVGIGTVGRVGLLKEKASSNQQITGLIFHDKIHSEYAYYWIRYIRKTIEAYSSNAVLSIINQKAIRSLPFKYPKSLNAQRRIVSKLDTLFAEIDASLALIDQNIMKAEALKLSVLDEEFGRIEHKEKLAKVTNFSPKKSEVRDKGNMECSFLPMKDLNEKQIDFQPQEIRKIEDVYKGYTYFKDNDVLLAKVTPCFQNRKAGVAKNLTNGIGFGSSEYFVFRPSAKIMAEYLYYFLMTADFINKGVVNMSGAVGLKRVTTDYIKRVEIPLPDLNHQKNVVNKIQNVFVEVDGLVKDYKQKRASLEVLKASLLDSAFKG